MVYRKVNRDREMQQGAKFGRLTFIKRTTRIKYIWKGLFSCECGGEVDAYISNVKKGNTTSCGCAKDEYRKKSVIRKHGMSNTREYSSWMNMVYRCSNNKATSYEQYGGRGISVCERWSSSFENFLNDMGERPEGMTLDRIDTNGNYEPSNCRWATKSDQMINVRKKLSTSSFYKGVSFHKNRNKWEAYLNVSGKRVRVGYFEKEIDAFNAYKKAYIENNNSQPLYPEKQPTILS